MSDTERITISHRPHVDDESSKQYSRNQEFFQKQILGDPQYAGRMVVVRGESVLAVGPEHMSMRPFLIPHLPENDPFRQKLEAAWGDNPSRLSNAFWGYVPSPQIKE